MTTSGSTDFSITRGNIINDALALVGIIDPDDTPGANQTQRAGRMLDMMVKNLQTKTDLWPTKDVTVTLTAGTQSYTVGSGADVDTPRPLRLISARRQDSSGTEIDVDVVSRQEYMSLPTKSTQSPVNTVYYDPQLDNGVLYVWPTGATGNLTLICTFQRPLEDFDATANTPDFPQEWYLLLVYQLGVLAAPLFGVQPSQLVIAMSQQLMTELEAWDEEPTSLFIQPGYMR